jgi:alpha-amylase
VLQKYPTIPISLHISGPLLDWLDINHPEYLKIVKNMVQSKQIELLSAGYYEPILASIPDHDKIGQIEKMNRVISEKFNYEPTGLWLTERVWEPHLVKPIQSTGMKYSAVDDYHFLTAGKTNEELDGYFLTDEQTSTMGIFPISQKLRYAIPFRNPEVTIEYLAKAAQSSENGLVVMADDGEKFGVWPGTHDLCYKKENWLNRFYSALEENSDWIKLTTFKEYYDTSPPRGRIYLPTVSYFEMNEWTLPGELGRKYTGLIQEHKVKKEKELVSPFIRGGFWRNFQTIYDESNWMQKRVTEISSRIEDAANFGKLTGADLSQSRNEIWKAQCNCAYWHGIFGGLYLPHLRHGIYQHLIAAENIIDRFMGPRSDLRDIDNDGYLEREITSDEIKLIVSEKGGVIRELDIRDKQFNLVNTMHQVDESYHSLIKHAAQPGNTKRSIHDAKVMKETGLEKYLKVEKHPRYMLVDHLLQSGTTLAKYMRQIDSDINTMLEKRYEINEADQIRLKGLYNLGTVELAIEKALALSKNELAVQLHFTNLGSGLYNGVYACELNFSLLGGHTPQQYYLINGKIPHGRFLDAKGTLKDVTKISLVNKRERFSVDLHFPDPITVWRYPVFTISDSESGMERIYQSSVVIPTWSISLKSMANISFSFKIKIELI